jgi:hypothetical protein
MSFNLGHMAEDTVPTPAEAPSDALVVPIGKSSWFKSLTAPWLAVRAVDVQAYRICDDLSGLLIFPMVLFGPWAFGTTQHWSVWVMNIAGYALGGLLLVKLFIRKAKGYPAMRWENFSVHAGVYRRRRRLPARWVTRWLAILTLAILAYCLLSAFNAAAVFNTVTRQFTYGHHLNWLPYSLDSHRTWFYFWMYLGLACSFWAIRDWLAGMTAEEDRDVHLRMEQAFGSPLLPLPARLRWLLWVLCINGALLGIEAIVQRASGSTELLFMVQPLVNPDGESQFGPYAYRSNAAQYFDLLWPVCLGFWWTLQRAGGYRYQAHHMLLPCAAIMAASAVISTSRGGALVAGGILILAMIALPLANFLATGGRGRRRSGGGSTAGLLGIFLILALALAWYFGWDTLAPRMADIQYGYQYREAMYDAARPMANDYPIFGTGPGTFATVFQLYRFSNATYWPEQLHNDWLETRITFGWVGFLLILAALACVALRWSAPGGIRGGRRFILLAWLSLVGCLVFAGFDFPFQVHSVLFLFLLICAILFNMGRKSSAHS